MAHEQAKESDFVTIELQTIDKSSGANQSEVGTSSSPSDLNWTEDGKKTKKRETWDNKFQFVLSLVGYAVGLGNVWRFSYQCAKNGGSAFIFPYLIMLFVLGIPLFYLELTIGQGTRRGPIGAWKKVSPNLMGIGVASFVINIYICLYYNVIIAWVIYYFFSSFNALLPWGNCFGYDVLNLTSNETRQILLNNADIEWSACFNSSSEYYWYNTALEVTDDINVAGVFNWRIFLSLLAGWIIVYLCLFRGIQLSGKVVYFTVIFPYLVMVCMFFRAVTLEGAHHGLQFLFLPTEGWHEKFFDPVVWLDAATQIFFSLGLSVGALVSLSSYSKPHNNALVDSIVVCLLNSATSIFSSIIVFSVVGFRAAQLNIDVSLVSEGPGLAFVIFGEALLRMPGAPVWAVLFFIMLFLLGIDSQFTAMEGVITVLRDNKRLAKLRKELLVGIVCLLFFIVSIPFILGNGVYLFSLVDQYAASFPLIITGFFEFIAVAWVFGVNKYFNTYATAYHPALLVLWTILWKWVNPIVMFVIFLGSTLRVIIEPLTFIVYINYEEVPLVYPVWAQFIGAMIILSSCLFIPGILIGRLIAWQSARDEALDFFKELKASAIDFYYKTRTCLTKVRRKLSDQVQDIEPSPQEDNQDPPVFSTTTDTLTLQ